MEDKDYINPFVNVHQKVKVLRDQAREASKSRAELQENLERLTKEALEKEHS